MTALETSYISVFFSCLRIKCCGGRGDLLRHRSEAVLPGSPQNPHNPWEELITFPSLWSLLTLIQAGSPNGWLLCLAQSTRYLCQDRLRKFFLEGIESYQHLYFEVCPLAYLVNFLFFLSSSTKLACWCLDRPTTHYTSRAAGKEREKRPDHCLLGLKSGGPPLSSNMWHPWHLMPPGTSLLDKLLDYFKSQWFSFMSIE